MGSTHIHLQSVTLQLADNAHTFTLALTVMKLCPFKKILLSPKSTLAFGTAAKKQLSLLPKIGNDQQELITHALFCKPIVSSKQLSHGLKATITRGGKLILWSSLTYWTIEFCTFVCRFHHCLQGCKWNFSSCLSHRNECPILWQQKYTNDQQGDLQSSKAPQCNNLPVL